MSIRTTLAQVVGRRSAADAPQAGASVVPTGDDLDLRLAPYRVVETTIRIPRQRGDGAAG